MDKDLTRALIIGTISTIATFYMVKYFDRKNLLPKSNNNEKED